MRTTIIYYLRIAAIGAMLATMPLPIKINNYSIIFAAVVAIFTYHWKDLRKDLTSYGSILLPALIFAVTLAGMLYTSDMPNGWSLVERSTSLIGLPVLVLLLYDGRRKTRDSLFRVFEAACFIFFVYCIYIACTNVIATGSLYNPEKIESVTDRRYYYFLNVELLEPVGISPIYLGMYINMCIVFSAVRLFVDRNISVLNITCLVLFSGFQLMIGSLNSIVVMGLIWVIVLLYGQIRNKSLHSRTLIYVAVPLIVIAATIVSIRPIRQRFIVKTEYQYEWDHIGYWNGITFRLAIWSCATDVIKDNALTGVGTGDADTALREKYKERNFFFGVSENFNSHNQYMQTWIMHGIFGLLTLIFVVLTPFQLAWRQRDIILAMFGLVIAIAFCTEVTIGTQKGIAFFSLFFALLSRRLSD